LGKNFHWHGSGWLQPEGANKETYYFSFCGLVLRRTDGFVNFSKQQNEIEGA
jgi:hypothetical protein